MFVYMHICVPCMCLMSQSLEESIVFHGTTWDLEMVVATLWVLGIEPGSPRRIGKVPLEIFFIYVHRTGKYDILQRVMI